MFTTFLTKFLVSSVACTLYRKAKGSNLLILVSNQNLQDGSITAFNNEWLDYFLITSLRQDFQLFMMKCPLNTECYIDLSITATVCLLYNKYCQNIATN